MSVFQIQESTKADLKYYYLLNRKQKQYNKCKKEWNCMEHTCIRVNTTIEWNCREHTGLQVNTNLYSTLSQTISPER